MGIVLVLTAIPVLDTYLIVGNAWQGILPTFTDELDFARMHTIGEGHLTDGNAYYLEHSDGPPLVLFGGAWLNAIPLFMGIPFTVALLINFIVWSLLFAAALHWLFLELRAPPWMAVFGTVLLYIQSYEHVWRPVNLQPVFPFYFLFYIALVRIIRDQSRRNILLLAFSVGVGFYLFAYLWQIAAITLGLLFLYALARKDWKLLKAITFSSSIGIVIGLPVPLYMLWLAHFSPYFWESMGRLGLVTTHLPMAEVIYSGGWVGIMLVFLAILHWRARTLREDKEFALLSLFIGVSGSGLWIMQGSNLITGKLLETGEHVRMLILPWLVFATISLGVLLWRKRTQCSREMQLFSVIVILVLSAANAYYTYYYFAPFLNVGASRELWQTEQLYAKPFAWLEQNEKNPVVVWSDPHDYLASVLPIYTKHFTLDTFFGMLELAPENEIRERYLVSQYFNNPTVADLESDREMALYLGRHDFPHEAETLNREVKICRLLFFWDKNKNCGTLTTPQELLGDAFFVNLEKEFQTEIKPHIQTYLEKYHVSYILKDKVLDPTYHPEVLGAKLVYMDDRYELWHL